MPRPIPSVAADEFSTALRCNVGHSRTELHSSFPSRGTSHMRFLGSGTKMQHEIFSSSSHPGGVFECSAVFNWILAPSSRKMPLHRPPRPGKMHGNERCGNVITRDIQHDPTSVRKVLPSESGLNRSSGLEEDFSRSLQTSAMLDSQTSKDRRYSDKYLSLPMYRA